MRPMHGLKELSKMTELLLFHFLFFHIIFKVDEKSSFPFFHRIYFAAEEQHLFHSFKISIMCQDASQDIMKQQLKNDSKSEKDIRGQRNNAFGRTSKIPNKWSQRQVQMMLDSDILETTLLQA